MSDKRAEGIGDDGLPTREGVYRAAWFGDDGFSEKEIDVYRHPVKGLCCFCCDFGSEGTESVDDATDCHVSVGPSSIRFKEWIRGLS